MQHNPLHRPVHRRLVRRRNLRDVRGRLAHRPDPAPRPPPHTPTCLVHTPLLRLHTPAAPSAETSTASRRRHVHHHPVVHNDQVRRQTSAGVLEQLDGPVEVGRPVARHGVVQRLRRRRRLRRVRPEAVYGQVPFAFVGGKTHGHPRPPPPPHLAQHQQHRCAQLRRAVPKRETPKHILQRRVVQRSDGRRTILPTAVAQKPREGGGSVRVLSRVVCILALLPHLVQVQPQLRHPRVLLGPPRRDLRRHAAGLRGQVGVRRVEGLPRAVQALHLHKLVAVDVEVRPVRRDERLHRRAHHPRHRERRACHARVGARRARVGSGG
eukprot:Rhum_TRINITY_DN14688_c10_g1::Rhum_TRINITY_DN14688_c10_g1_i1::g.109010::m.109010